MNRSRALLLFSLVLLVPGALAADVVYASRQFEIAPPTSSPESEQYLSVAAAGAGPHGFVVGWDMDLDYPDPESPRSIAEGCALLSDGHLAEGHFDNWDTTMMRSSGIRLARTDEARAAAVWEALDVEDASWISLIAFKLVDLDGRLTEHPSIELGRAHGVFDSAPVVASGGRGPFVIAWTRTREAGRTAQPMARVFDADGLPLSPETAVAEPASLPPSMVPPPGVSRVRAAGMDAEGRFVVLFDNLWGRRFDQTGQPLGEPFRVGTSSGPVEMGMRPAGDFLVTWQAPANPDVLLLARFTPDGRRVGGQPVRLRARDASLAMDSAGRAALFWIDRQKARRRPALAVFGPALERLSPVLYDPPASRGSGGLAYGRETAVAFADDGRILTTWLGPRGPNARDSVVGRIWQVR